MDQEPFNTMRQTSLTSRQNEQLVELRNSSSLQLNFESMPLAEFWASAEGEVPELADVALRALVLFISTYLCETGFSIYCSTKTKYRNRLNAEPDVRIQLSHKTPPFAELAARKQYQPSH